MQGGATMILTTQVREYPGHVACTKASKAGGSRITSPMHW